MTEHERGMLLSTMSDASVALMLGRGVAWVVRQRKALRAPEPELAPRPAVLVLPSGPTAGKKGHPPAWFVERFQAESAGWRRS